MTDTLRLGNHCEKIGSGATPRGGKESYLDDGPISLIRSQNILNDRFSHAGLASISHEQAAQLQNVEVKEGDVLLNITGDSVARVCQVDPSVLPARVNQHVAIIRPNPNEIDPRFLRYYLVAPSMQAHMLGLAAAGATRNALTKSMIESFRVPAWPVERQRAIASVLGALDDQIELNRRMNETLEATARAIFKDWFVDFGPTRSKMNGETAYLAPDVWALFPDSLDNEGKPEGWKKGSLAELIQFSPTEPLRKGNVTPYLDMAALPTEGPIADTPKPREYSSGTRFRNGDTLLARITPCLQNGKAAFIQGLRGGEVAWGSTEFIVMRSKAPVPSAFSYLLAREPAFKRAAIQSMTGTSGRQRASVEMISRYPMTFPVEAPVWAALNEILGALFTRIAANAEATRTLAAIRDVLLPKLISGEVSVGDATKIVGETT